VAINGLTGLCQKNKRHPQPFSPKAVTFRPNVDELVFRSLPIQHAVVLPEGRLNLDGRVSDTGMIVQMSLKSLQEIVIQRLTRHDKVNRQRGFSGTQRPDVEIVNATDIFDTKQIFGDTGDIYVPGHGIKSVV